MRRTLKTGFTLTELLVLVSLGAILSALIVPDLAQTRARLLQQACAANMKQWGMAIDMYSQDYNGTFYYDVGGAGWDDGGSPPSPYGRYLIGTNANPNATMRRMRICPARQVGIDPDVSPSHSYSMPIGTYRKGFGYANADEGPRSPYYGSFLAPYWPNLKSVPNPSNYLLMIESNGHTLHCGGLVNAVSTVLGTDADQVPAISRHGGGVNCLFGDFRVEFVSYETITNQNAKSCNDPSSLNWWFALN
jgi:prepilin-type processing-associated H-X9-DG protein